MGSRFKTIRLDKISENISRSFALKATDEANADQLRKLVDF